MKTTLVIGVAVFLAGCATGAQRQLQAMTAGNQAAAAAAKNCSLGVYNSPEAAILRPHLPPDIRETTLMQLSDQSLATDAEIAAIRAIHPRYKACQRAFLDALLHSEPGIVPALTKAYSEADDDTVLVVQRKMSWGERVHRARDRMVALTAVIQADAQRVVADLQQQHQAELEQRQAAAQAFAQWAETQQLINAATRPVTTNCMQTGFAVNCIIR